MLRRWGCCGGEPFVELKGMGQCILPWFFRKLTSAPHFYQEKTYKDHRSKEKRRLMAIK